jgi:hypothetical protein
MSNKLVGYAILIPTVLGFIALFTLGISEPLLSRVDEQVYFAVFFVVTIALLIGVVKLFWLPNREKQWIPIKNRVLLFWTVLFSVIAAASAELDFGEQLEMLIGLVSLIVIFTVSFRLITTPVKIDEQVEKIDYTKELKNLGIVFVTVIALLALLVFMDSSETIDHSDADSSLEDDGTTEELMGTPLTEEELVSVVKEFVAIYHQLYFITQDDSPEAETAIGILNSFLTEAMSDKNKLERLVPRISTLSNHESLPVRANGIALLSGVNQLIIAQTNYLTFLRSVDADNVDMSEFQYQISLLQTESKDAFFTIIEGSSAMNIAYMDYTARVGDSIPILIGKSSQAELLAEIDRLFSDVFIEHEQWNQETGFVNAPVSIVEQWRQWIAEMAPVKP